MESKKQSKRKIWSCDEGCDLTKGTPCEHLERLLTDPQGPSFEGTRRRVDKPIDSFYYNSGAGFVIPEGIKSGKYERQFREKLKTWGLTAIQVDIMVGTFIYEDTIKEIAKDLSIPTLSTVVRLRSEALRLLRTKGYGKR